MLSADADEAGSVIGEEEKLNPFQKLKAVCACIWECECGIIRIQMFIKERG